MNRNMRFRTLGALLIASAFVILLPSVRAAGKYKYQTLYKIPLSGDNGAYPSAGLALDAIGNLYGTTKRGGTSDCGTVFQLTPNDNGKWVNKVLHSFTCWPNDGQRPVAGVILDRTGTLYGTTSEGGDSSSCPDGCGTVFALVQNQGEWTEKLLHVFNGMDGASPVASLIEDAVGNLYGTASALGTNDSGTVFELILQSDGSWKEKTLHKFTGGSDGGGPVAGVIFDSARNLYATTVSGGTHGQGAVFELMPKLDGGWKEKVLYSFAGGPDGSNPAAGVTFDSAGKIYGTASGGGSSNRGVVFRLSPTGNGSWNEKVLHQFTAGADGGYPAANLLFDAMGNLYGTTPYGGIENCEGDLRCGVVFRLEPDAKGNWHETVLHSFSDHPGAHPFAGVIFDAGGSLYGTTYGDGFITVGSVFRLTP